MLFFWLGVLAGWLLRSLFSAAEKTNGGTR